MIEKLTDNDRAYFAQHMPGDVRSKALRVIDAQAARIAELERRNANQAASHHLPRVQDVAEIHELMTKLAAATALIHQARQILDGSCATGWLAVAYAFLAGQPAAPDTKDEES